MKRDRWLMLEILSYMEERPDVPPKMLTSKDFTTVKSDPDTIGLHMELLHDAGLIEMVGHSARRITMAGYDYLYARRGRCQKWTSHN